MRKMFLKKCPDGITAVMCDDELFELAKVSYDLREMVVTAEEFESIKYLHARRWLDRFEKYRFANADLQLT